MFNGSWFCQTTREFFLSCFCFRLAFNISNFITKVSFTIFPDF